MADPVRLTRKRKSGAAAPPAELTQDEQSGLLSQAGGAAMSGLHTLGSILSYPSRVLHGTINAATGGEGGFGENILNPLDSRGGIEGSHHLVRAGILAKNDPNAWEWGDLGRGLADMALDPTTWAGPGLTKAGFQAAKAGKLAAGRVAQTAERQRALLNIGLPWADPVISIGTGPKVAQALSTIGRKTGLTAATEAVKRSKPFTLARAGFDYAVQGLTHPDAQKYVAAATKNMEKANVESNLDITRAARSMPESEVNKNVLRHALEGTADSPIKGFTPHEAASGAVDSPHVTMHLSPNKLADKLGNLPDPGTHLDDLLESGAPVKSAMAHIDKSGNLQFGVGPVNREARRIATERHGEYLKGLQDELGAIPPTITVPPPESPHKLIMDAISSVRGGDQGALATSKELRAATGLPKDVFDKAFMELAGRKLIQPHKHDLPSSLDPEDFANLVDSGRLDVHPNDGRYFVGAAKDLNAPHDPTLGGLHTPGVPQEIPNPEYLTKQNEIAQFAGKKMIRNYVQTVRKELQAAHNPEEALATLAKIKQLGEAGIAVTVPKKQYAEFQRRFGMEGGAKRDIGFAHHELENLKQLPKTMLQQAQEMGVGNQEALRDVHGFFPRRASIEAEVPGAGPAISRGSKVLPGKGAEDVGRDWYLKGNSEGTAGTNRVVGDIDAHDAVEAAKAAGVPAQSAWKAAVPILENKYGHNIERLYQDPKQVQTIARAAKSVQATTDKLAKINAKKAALESDIAAHKAIDLTGAPKETVAAHNAVGASLQKKLGTATDSKNAVERDLFTADQIHKKALVTGKDRIKKLAQYVAGRPELKGKELFGNDPLVDLRIAKKSHDKKISMAPAVYQTIAKNLNGGDQGIKLGDFLKSGGFSPRAAAEKIAGHTFADAKELKAFLSQTTIDSKLADQLEELTPTFKAPTAVNEASKIMKSIMAWWKGGTLAVPASRARDALGGAVQNILHGWGNPKFLFDDTNKLLNGEIVTTPYGHVTAVKDWLAKSGKQWSPENQTEALRQLAAAYLPSEHNMLADVPVGQVGATRESLTHNVPGKTKSTFRQKAIVDPLKTLAGMGPGGERWFGAPQQAGETFGQRVLRGLKEPFVGVRGVGDRTETTLAPVKASEMVSSLSDQYNRTWPWLQQLHGGTDPGVAAQNVNRAQVDYCVDDETQILTNTGWKSRHELNVGDMCLTLDMDSQKIVWRPALAVNVFEERWRAMHKWEGSGLDSLTTGGHRWLARSGRYVPVRETATCGAPSRPKRENQPFWRWMDSDHIYETQCTLILGGGEYDYEGPLEFSDEFVELCGWYVTEGSIRNKSGISVAQSARSNPKFVARIKAIQEHYSAIGATANQWPDVDNGWGTICNFYFGLGIGPKVRKFCPNKTLSMELLTSLTRSQLELLYSTILDGDKERRAIDKTNGRESARISQRRKDVVEGFQILAAMLGKRSWLTVTTENMHRMQVLSTPFLHSPSLKKSIVEHYGHVWCPTIETGIWMARRNGRVYWTGNSPDTFTAVERGIKNNVFPFWSFNSRMIPETARQVSNFGSPTSQMIKAIDRSHGGGDPSVPDYVMSGTGIPLGVRDDGSKSYLSGLGLMSEGATSMLGLLAAGAGGNSNALRAAGYDTLGMLHPLAGIPLQRTTGQSFFMRGQPIENLDSTTGRLMSNVGESLGLREPGSDVVRYPGSSVVDATLGATPFGRLASQARTLADPRKDMASKLVDTLTGARVTDVSRGKQLATLQKRAEDLARSEGAFESRMVGFSKDQIAKLKETNPELAARQQQLQNLITGIKRRKASDRKAKKAAEAKK